MLLKLTLSLASELVDLTVAVLTLAFDSLTYTQRYTSYYGELHLDL